MPEMLGDVGYATAMFGKWHLGQAEGRYPTDQGFDEWYGIPNSTDESLWPSQEMFQKFGNWRRKAAKSHSSSKSTFIKPQKAQSQKR